MKLKAASPLDERFVDHSGEALMMFSNKRLKSVTSCVIARDF